MSINCFSIQFVRNYSEDEKFWIGVAQYPIMLNLIDKAELENKPEIVEYIAHIVLGNQWKEQLEEIKFIVRNGKERLKNIPVIGFLFAQDELYMQVLKDNREDVREFLTRHDFLNPDKICSYYEI